MTGTTFTLHRHSDPSGVSGTGIVADGVEFEDRTVALRWHGKHPATAVWSSVEDMLAIHGHQGQTTLVWDTPEQYTPTATSNPGTAWDTHDDPEVTR